MYHVRGGELVEIEANRQAIGGKLEAGVRIKRFDLRTVQGQEGDCLYLFSDGYGDQFGRVGDQNRKFGPKRLRGLLAQMHGQPMAQQRARLLQDFMTWKGSLMQLDDVLIVGVRL
jgi:serine phosphatase RsbU (regulator of sigma subunit)